MYKVAGSVGAALLYLTLGKQYPLSVLGGEFASYPYSVDSSIIPSVLVFSRESTLAHNNGHAHNNCVIIYYCSYVEYVPSATTMSTLSQCQMDEDIWKTNSCMTPLYL